MRMDHGTLSQILRGRRPITRKTIRRMGTQLGLSEPLIAYYARKPDEPTEAVSAAPVQLGLDAFHVTSDWHHYAILELIHVKDFRPDSRWIAKSLGITVNDVNIALQRLLRLELLEMAGAKWIDKSEHVNISNEKLTPVLRKKVQAQAHQLALEAIERVSGEHIEQDSVTMAINSQQLAQLGDLIHEFFESAQAILAGKRNNDDVYQIQISAVPLTTYKRGRTKNG
jgi:uncharacterized protein (TIGR02147 family)